ncbi:MAG: leucine-rich repeat domain-containing protein [Kiritimatiellae bacterium]|nr:leucine-rich repeat domain-containing protein [Kiritimatiellia bacterium]
MQAAGRSCLWNGERTGTEIVLRMTAETGLYIAFLVRPCSAENPVYVTWGDGGGAERVWFGEDDHATAAHAYAKEGTYLCTFHGAKSVGLRVLANTAHYAYEKSIISVVDRSGEMTQIDSGAYRFASNLEKFLAPWSQSVGQSSFASCYALKTLKLGALKIVYDAAFAGLRALEDFETVSIDKAWNDIWSWSTGVKVLKLGNVNQFGMDVLYGTTNLTDVYIQGKTVLQIQGKAPSGNLKSFYATRRFPWDAKSTVRFHGSDGIVLGNGTIVQQ